MSPKELAELEQASFNSFDPNNFNDYDPDGFTTNTGGGTKPVNQVMRGKVGKLQAQFDIIITSDCDSSSTKIELFNGFRSQSEATNNQVSLLTPIAGPELAAALNAAGAGGATAGTDALKDRLYFNAAGSLVYNDFTNGNGKVTISCRQVPYIALLKSSMVQPFKCEKLRMTVLIDAQIDNDLVHITNSFLGSQKRNSVSPRSFFRPDQFQGLIIDLPTAFNIDGEKGLEYIINNKGALPAQVVTFNMFLSRYVKQQIS